MASAEFRQKLQNALQLLPDEQTRAHLLRMFPSPADISLGDVERQVENVADLSMSQAQMLAWLLGRVGNASSTAERLIVLAGEGLPPDVRAEALSSLALIIWGTEEAEMVSVFEGVLDDPVPVVATASSHALRAIHNAASVRVLEEAVANVRLLADVRGYAAESLGEVLSSLLEREHPQALVLRDRAEKLLLTSCRAPEPEVAYWSVFALALCGTTHSLVVLTELQGQRRYSGDWDQRIQDQVQEAICAVEARG
jgi:hypothetical protein